MIKAIIRVLLLKRVGEASGQVVIGVVGVTHSCNQGILNAAGMQGSLAYAGIENGQTNLFLVIMIAVFCSVSSFFYIRNDISLCLRHGYFVDILPLHNTEKVQLHSISVGTFGYQIQLKHAWLQLPQFQEGYSGCVCFFKSNVSVCSGKYHILGLIHRLVTHTQYSIPVLILDLPLK